MGVALAAFSFLSFFFSCLVGGVGCTELLIGAMWKGVVVVSVRVEAS
jgi:hypothetical protein